ncbi:MAG: translocase [Planctomycetaceae bacterium]|nr:translocase [Planctomycetaceae bacterium]
MSVQFSNSLSRWQRQADQILADRRELESVRSDELLQRIRNAAWQAKSGAPLSKLLPTVYALAIEATRRVTGKIHYPVQVMGALALFEGHIAEMQTGEGKTLTAVLPVTLRALMGRGVHVITSNNYLAQRDAEEMGAIYRHLGLTTDCVHPELQDEERRAAYGCDITYGTASEMGFDFLRDRLRQGALADEDRPPRQFFEAFTQREPTVQRGHYFALIDEADSILIDESRTPLIIGLEQPNPPAMVSLYRWCVGMSQQLRFGDDFEFDPQKRQAHLTEHGARNVVLLAKPVLLDSVDMERIYQHVEKALTAQLAYERDRDYVIADDEVVIVDEGTGRKMEGRKWQEGLHQLVEAKESVPITPPTSSAARITIQSFYRRYEHLAGMTGTATQARQELKRTYRLHVSVIPTHRPCIRRGLSTRVFVSQAAKREAIASAVREQLAAGRSVLIGTPSVDASEGVAAVLLRHDIDHAILNARFHDLEAEIVQRAGVSGSVTIATNMAGRGTDILLEDTVRHAGGLHVIATELHTSKRIDRQLVGRSARQGDPGTFQFFLSLEDELLRVLPPAKRQRSQQQARPNSQGELPSNWARLFHRTQANLESLHTKQRRRLLEHEKEQAKKYRRMGLDPYLELAE